MYMYRSSSTKSPEDSYLVCIYWKWSWNSNKSRPPRCTCLCTREQGWVWVFVCYFSSPIDSYLCVCICMYMYVNTTERLRFHKAVILLLIMKYFVLKTIFYSHTTTPCNLIKSSPPNGPTQRKSPTGHTRWLCLNLQRLMRGTGINVCSYKR